MGIHDLLEEKEALKRGFSSQRFNLKKKLEKEFMEKVNLRKQLEE